MPFGTAGECRYPEQHSFWRHSMRPPLNAGLRPDRFSDALRQLPVGLRHANLFISPSPQSEQRLSTLSRVWYSPAFMTPVEKRRQKDAVPDSGTPPPQNDMGSADHVQGGSLWI